MIFHLKNFVVFFMIFFMLFSCERKEKIKTDNNSDISINIILPQTTSIYGVYLTEENIRFTANIKSLKDISLDTPVIWEVDKGVISEDGEYTTPSEPCDVKVTARIKDVFDTVNIKIFKSVPDVERIKENFYFLADSVFLPSTLKLDPKYFWNADMESECRAMYVDGGCLVKLNDKEKYHNNVSWTEYNEEFFGNNDNPLNFLIVRNSDAFEGLECLQMKVPRVPNNILHDGYSFEGWAWLAFMFSVTDRDYDSVLSRYKFFAEEDYRKIHVAYKIDSEDMFEDGALIQFERHYISEKDRIEYFTSRNFVIVDELENDGEWHELEMLFPPLKEEGIFYGLIIVLKNNNSSKRLSKGTIYIDDVYMSKEI